MKLRNKLLILGLAATLAFPFTAMAEDASSAAPDASQNSAKTIVTQDGVLKITSPLDNDSWSVIQDDKNWFAMSDGTDIITANHYANGEAIPAAEIADSNFVQIYQVHYSTNNEIFVVTGKVTVAGDMPYVRNSVDSFEVLQYDTKTAVAPAAPAPEPQSTYDIAAIGATMYCTTPDGVHVRADHSIDSAVIGEIGYQQSVYVNGSVTKDGADTGWYQIQYGNGIGYVWAEWFDTNQPPADPVPTGDTMIVYSYDGSDSRQIYMYTDGIWRDDSGNTYSGDMSAEVQCSDGTVWYQSPMGPSQTGDSMTIYSYDGSETREIYMYTDGVWRDDNGNTYSGGMSAEVQCSDGTVWYESPMGPVPTGDSMTIYSYDGSMAKEIYHYSDGTWMDDDGVVYTSNGRSAEIDGSDGSVWYESPIGGPDDDEKPNLLMGG